MPEPGMLTTRPPSRGRRIQPVRVRRELHSRAGGHTGLQPEPRQPGDHQPPGDAGFLHRAAGHGTPVQLHAGERDFLLHRVPGPQRRRRQRAHQRDTIRRLCHVHGPEEPRQGPARARSHAAECVFVRAAAGHGRHEHL